MTYDNGSFAVTDDTVHLAGAADRLRLVRAARERFLALHAVDHLLGDGAAGADRLARDLDGAGFEPGATPDNHAGGPPFMRSLFRDGRLDD